MKMLNPTEDQINAAVAEFVAGMKIVGLARMWIRVGDGDHAPIPKFTRSMDAVLPLLEKQAFILRSTADGFHVTIGPSSCWEKGPLARSCCIALLRAHGVEVEFTT